MYIGSVMGLSNSYSCLCLNLRVDRLSLVMDEDAVDATVHQGSTRTLNSQSLQLSPISSTPLRIKVAVDYLTTAELVEEGWRVYYCLNCKVAAFAEHPQRALFATQHTVQDADLTAAQGVRYHLGIVINNFPNNLPRTVKIRWNHVLPQLRKSLTAEMDNIDQEKHLAIEQFIAQQAQLASRRKAIIKDSYLNLEDSLSKLPRVKSVDAPAGAQRLSASGGSDGLSDFQNKLAEYDSDNGSWEGDRDFFGNSVELESSESEDEEAFLATDDSVSPLPKQALPVAARSAARQSKDAGGGVASSMPIAIGHDHRPAKLRTASSAFDEADEELGAGENPYEKMRELSISVREVSTDVFGELPEHSERRLQFSQVLRSYAQ